jgi:hypothetical protein
VIFFVPHPAKGVAEMVRVVAPGGTVATYAWGNCGRWIAYGANLRRDAHDGHHPLLPPSPGASRIETLRE